MYSQNELDEAVAAGAISAEPPTPSRIRRPAAGAPSAVDEEQFRLITGFNDIFVSIAAAILLFAVAGSASRSARRWASIVDHDGPSPIAPLLVAATAWGLALFFTAKRRMALPSILLLLAFVGGVMATAGFTLVVAVGPDNLDNNEARGGIDRRGCGGDRRRRGLAPLEAIPRPDHGCGRRSGGGGDRCRPARLGTRRRRRPIAEHHSRLRPAARHRHVPVRHAVGFARIRRASPAAATSLSGCTCWRRR